MAGRALPSHLKPSAAEGGEGGFAPRHHGKTQSHVVSLPLIVQMHGASCLVRVSWASAVMAPSCKLPAAEQVLSAQVLSLRYLAGAPCHAAGAIGLWRRGRVLASARGFFRPKRPPVSEALRTRSQPAPSLYCQP